MTRILITGAGGSAASNFCDALRHDTKRSYQIIGSDAKPYHLELAPLEGKYLVPPASDPAFCDAINGIIAKEGIDFVHPQPDVEVAWFATNRERINAPTFLPDANAIELCHDKMTFNERLGSRGVAVPRAFHITDQAALKQALEELLEPATKVWLRAIRGAGSRASLPVGNFQQADAWIDYWQMFRGIDYGDFMASEFLPGPEFAWQSLWRDGQLITCQARERVEYIFGNLTPSGQTSSPSVARTVNRDDVNQIGEQAVRAVSDTPHGVYCVDMKERSDGVPCVTEINIGRFFTTSNFFAHAGLNMPAMYLELGLGNALTEMPPKYNPLKENLYWVRMIDMGFKLVEGDSWSAVRV
jgi:biotin carboxylase